MVTTMDNERYMKFNDKSFFPSWVFYASSVFICVLRGGGGGVCLCGRKLWLLLGSHNFSMVSHSPPLVSRGTPPPPPGIMKQ